MPRSIRQKGNDCIYHIMERGNEKKNIFNCDDDKIRFIETLSRMKEKYNFSLYAYCLMDNHIHLLVGSNQSDISDIMQSVNISYTYYFNKVYKRCGHLFQDRFVSKVIDSSSYLLESSKYIHNNPIKSGIVNSPELYKWSSYCRYTENANMIDNLIDTSTILEMFSNSKELAMQCYAKYVTTYSGYIFEHIDDDDVSDPIDRINAAKQYIQEFIHNNGVDSLYINQNVIMRNKLINELLNIYKLKYSVLGSLFGGLSKTAIYKIVKQSKHQEPVPV